MASHRSCLSSPSSSPLPGEDARAGEPGEEEVLLPTVGVHNVWDSIRPRLAAAAAKGGLPEIPLIAPQRTLLLLEGAIRYAGGVDPLLEILEREIPRIHGSHAECHYVTVAWFFAEDRLADLSSGAYRRARLGGDGRSTYRGAAPAAADEPAVDRAKAADDQARLRRILSDKGMATGAKGRPSDAKGSARGKSR